MKKAIFLKKILYKPAWLRVLYEPEDSLDHGQWWLGRIRILQNKIRTELVTSTVQVFAVLDSSSELRHEYHSPVWWEGSVPKLTPNNLQQRLGFCCFCILLVSVSYGVWLPSSLLILFIKGLILAHTNTEKKERVTCHLNICWLIKSRDLILVSLWKIITIFVN